MKNYILFIAFAFTLAIQAQEFKATETYAIEEVARTKEQPAHEGMIHIVTQNEGREKVATLSIFDIDIFEEARVTVLANPDLKGIAEVVKVELEYLACCPYAEDYYFLVGDNGEYTSLPRITNDYCEAPLPSERYIFPSQKDGKKETIVRAKFHYGENNTIEEMEVIKSYAFNDDDFEYEDAAIVIQY